MKMIGAFTFPEKSLLKFEVDSLLFREENDGAEKSLMNNVI